MLVQDLRLIVANFYNRLQGTATNLLTKFNQGVIRHWRAGSNTGSTFNPVIGSPTYTTLNATARGVESKYVNDYVSGSDIQVISAVFGLEPTSADKIELNGKLHEIVQVDRIPASGTIIAWRLFLKS